MSEDKLTLAVVAREAGVSSYVASLALRGRKGVAAATRERVEAVAERLGYRVNGAAAFLAQQRGGKKDTALRVGYLVAASWWKGLDFEKACGERGWHGEVMQVGEWSTPEQAARLAWSQGFDGLLLGAASFSAAQQADLARFDWGKFAAVKMSRGLPELPLHLVRHSAFDYMMTTLEAVWERGYRRIVVALHRSASSRDDQARLGALLAFREEHAGERDFSCGWRRQRLYNRLGRITDESCLGWVRESGAEVVVVDHWVMGQELMAAGLRVPEEVGLAAMMTENANGTGGPKFSGCDALELDRYRMALNILAGEILAGRKGLAEHPLEHVMEPVWLDGETLPRR